MDLWVNGIYGDLFSPGPFIINPCLDLWGFMGIYAKAQRNIAGINLSINMVNAKNNAGFIVM